MDGFSLIVGSALGILAGWAFSSATIKRRDASRKLNKANKVKEEISKKKGEARNNVEGRLADTLQGIFLFVLGVGFVFVLGLLLFSSFG
jgi:hypothetical protein